VKPFVRTVMSTVGVAILSSGVLAQDKTAPPPSPKALVPLKVLIVVSRYQGEKKVSSLPYTLTVNANDRVTGPLGQFEPRMVQLRTGASIPVPSMAPPKESPMQGPVGPVQYKPIGINIDCTAQSTDDGRFRVDISIEDTSVYSEGQTAEGVAKMSDIPSFRTFQTSNTVILKDGQSSEFTAAADRISGEVTKIDITVTVVKER
jgi:Bacterial type II and III secretion system protein